MVMWIYKRDGRKEPGKFSPDAFDASMSEGPS